MKISEIITDKYKLRIPPTVYYDLLADVVEEEEKQLSTTKNDLGVDLVSRADVLKLMQDNWHTHNGDWAMQESMDDIRALPTVTPQEPFINKPCVSSEVCEHDKQKVLEKIRAEIEQLPTYNKFTGASYPTYEFKSDVLNVIDKYKAESKEETETWNGIHAQITAPKGTFDKIFNDTEEDIDDI